MAGMKFSMEAEALTEHTKQGETNNADLRGLVNQLLAAAEPLSNKFNGPAKEAFDYFKENVDSVSTDLHNAHSALMTSAAAQNNAFITASNEAQDTHSRTNAGSDFASAATKNL